MSNHTPGPWHVVGRPRTYPYEAITANGPRVLAKLPRYKHGPHEPELQANARLIAAAPDLLEACLSGHDDGMDGDLLSLVAGWFRDFAATAPGYELPAHLRDWADQLDAKQALQHAAVRLALNLDKE